MTDARFNNDVMRLNNIQGFFPELFYKKVCVSLCSGVLVGIRSRGGGKAVFLEHLFSRTVLILLSIQNTF